MASRSRITDLYIQRQAEYARLSEEIAVILKAKLRSADIPFASVTWRAKTLESMLSKVERKGYTDPGKQITDMAGVRLVYLYASDFAKIAKIVEDEFGVLGRSERPSPEVIDKFGYAAHHYDVCLKSCYYGPRYDDLRSLLCEIQVRTVLQDAWALVAHHLEYKREDSVPAPLRRSLHALAGAFEIADNHLDQLGRRRAEYVASLATFHRTASKATGLDYDAFLAYIARQEPRLRVETTRGAAQNVLESLHDFGVTTVEQLVNCSGHSVTI